MLDERLKIKDERCFELSSWRPVGLIGSIALLFAFLFLSACTDYVSKIDDQIAELNAYQDEDLTELSSDSRDESSDKTKKSSSSSKKKVSSSSAVNPSSSSGVTLSEGDGSLTDSRDGQVYKTVKIGSQTWMAENLNYKTAESYCYDDKSANCEKYGRLYTWAAAKKACPSGWHLPDTTEWNILALAVGGDEIAGKMLKSKSNWEHGGNGIDAYSFSAFPYGCRYFDDGGYWDVGEFAGYWSSNQDNDRYAFFMGFYAASSIGDQYYADNSAYIDYDSYVPKSSGFSVRCLKD